MANFANLSDIVSTTMQSRSGTLADNVTNNDPLLIKMRERGNVKPFSGGNVIMEEIMYNDAATENAGSYSGYDVIDITPNSPISAAQFDIKQYAAAVSMSGLEMLQNAGKEQIIDLLEGRIQIAEAQLMNDIGAGIYSDGTGNSGKDITGLALAVSAAPSSGTYGGINRANWSFWRNVAFDATTDGGAAATSANIQSWQQLLSLLPGKPAGNPAHHLGSVCWCGLYLAEVFRRGLQLRRVSGRRHRWSIEHQSHVLSEHQVSEVPSSPRPQLCAYRW